MRVHLLSPREVLDTSARLEIITVNLATVQAVVHFTEAAGILRPYTSILTQYQRL